jgi:hypothetical protein
MTPEDIEQLKRLKALFDDGVLTTEEFELQNRGLLSSPDRRVDAPWSIEDIELDEGFIVHAADDVYRREAADDDYKREVVDEAIGAAGRVQILAYLFAFAGIIFGIILMAYKEDYGFFSERRPYVAQGIGVALNAVVLAIILHAIGKYMEARLVQGERQSPPN